MVFNGSITVFQTDGESSNLSIRSNLNLERKNLMAYSAWAHHPSNKEFDNLVNRVEKLEEQLAELKKLMPVGVTGNTVDSDSAIQGSNP
jgi:hypothetical protein